MYNLSTKADFEIIAQCDTCLILVDLDAGGRSLTNDAHRVIHELNHSLPGGIGSRKVYYRDSMSRYDQLIVKNGEFKRFAPCSADQQLFLAKLTKETEK